MRSTRRRPLAMVLGALGLLAVACASVSFSTAAFTDQKSNPSNAFDSSTYFGFFASGSYQGNGVDNRAFTNVGFRPDVVIIKGNSAQTSAIRTSTMSGDAAKPLAGATALTADVIQSLTATGFTIGTNARVNTAGVSYEWMAFRAQSGLLRVGTYTGNGSSQAIAGLGFSPEYAAVFSPGASNAVQRYSGMTTSFQFDADAGNATRITSLNADGFSVGNQNTVNTNGTVYHYVAFNDTAAGAVDIGTYAGNNTDNRGITGVGFKPEYVAIRANDNRIGAHRPVTLPGDATLRHNAAVNAANSIQAIQSDGFQVGTDVSVNANSVAYHYLAARDTADSSGGGCGDPGSQLLAASADTYVDQNAAGSNFGGGTSLFVRSGTGNTNRRTLVRFNLPALPSGCTLTGASLRMFSTAAVAGRTIDVYRAASQSPVWGENTVNWNTAPATTGTASSLTSAAGSLTWDVTAQAQAMYSGTNNGFVVRDQTENSNPARSQTYQAREGTPDTQDPELRIAWG